MAKTVKTFFILLIIGLAMMISSCAKTDPITRKVSGRAPLKIRLMTYNILMGAQASRAVSWGSGIQTAATDRKALIIDMIKEIDADVVFLQECNGWADDEGRILKEMASAANMFGAIAPNKGPFKVAILSRFPILNQYWLGDDNPYGWNIIYADLGLPGGRTLKVASTHTAWWTVPEWWNAEPQTKILLYDKQVGPLFDELQKYKDIPFIIAGDFNHPDRNKINRHTDQELYVDIPYGILKKFLPRIKALGYKNVYTEINTLDEDDRTVPGGGGVIDHIFASGPIASFFTDCRIVENSLACQSSDHLPVWADLELP
jgi:endonuclease/exonuclease/phosphatase family metal-dependent hydrolase